MKKLLLIIAAVSFLFFPLLKAQPALAAAQDPNAAIFGTGTWYVPTMTQYQQQTFNSTDESMSLQRFNLVNLVYTAEAIISAGGGIETTVQTSAGPVQSYQGGALQIMANLTSSLYTTQPASSVEYIADLGSSLGIIKPAYAQGVGFTAFTPILKIWKTFRDIAYLAFVIIFIIVGMMVMFRKKIDPRTVVTIQDALPRVVVTLLLITFSYAIAGLIIDTGEFLTRLVGSTLNKNELIAVQGSGANQQANLDKLYAANIFQLVNPLRNVDNLMKTIEAGNIPLVKELSNIPLLGDLTIRLIFLIAGIFIMFKIFFALLGPYISIILSIVFAPFILLMGAIPGSQTGVTSWLKDLIGKVLVFPATFAMLAMAAVFKGSATSNAVIFPGGNAAWGVAGNYAIGWAPATIGNWGSVVGDLIAFGILFTIPHVVEMIQSSLGSKAQPWESAPASELKGAASRLPVIGGLISGAMG